MFYHQTYCNSVRESQTNNVDSQRERDEEDDDDDKRTRDSSTHAVPSFPLSTLSLKRYPSPCRCRAFLTCATPRPPTLRQMINKVSDKEDDTKRHLDEDLVMGAAAISPPASPTRMSPQASGRHIV